MKQLPVWSLKKGMRFVGADGQVWTVDEVQEPPGYRSLGQIGEQPKAHTIYASRGQSNRRFYHHGGKLMDIVEDVK